MLGTYVRGVAESGYITTTPICKGVDIVKVLKDLM
jgi:hypothetical protein